MYGFHSIPIKGKDVKNSTYTDDKRVKFAIITRMMLFTVAIQISIDDTFACNDYNYASLKEKRGTFLLVVS